MPRAAPSTLGLEPLGDGGAWDRALAGSNGFDATRLALATLVVFAHAFFLAEGTSIHDPVFKLTDGQTNAGLVAVYMFFVLSGFMVTRSEERTTTLGYLARRILRIVPGFVVASLIGLFVVGPLFSGPGYLHRQHWLALAGEVVSLHEANPTDVHTFAGNPIILVHGTLWSIRYEFDCYLALAALGITRCLRPPLRAPAFVVIAATLLALHFWPLPELMTGLPYLLVSSPERWSELFSFFAVGTGLYLWRDRVPVSALLCIAAAVLLVVGFINGLYYPALLVGGSYLVLYVSVVTRAELRLFGARVDLSYGVYLYGWLVEQVLEAFFHLAAWPLFFASILPTILIAYVSWTLIEAPSLRLVHSKKGALVRPPG